MNKSINTNQSNQSIKQSFNLPVTLGGAIQCWRPGACSVFWGPEGGPAMACWDGMSISNASGSAEKGRGVPMNSHITNNEFN